uniref:Bromo domain-containing protein n=1 Tax=Ditylenchus dipsaci TaxID=166011 RepID=A0A915D6I3_9BILA
MRASSQSIWAPVDRTLLPEYYEHVKKPMDLGTNSSKLETNQYTRVGEFTADIRLVFSNSTFQRAVISGLQVFGQDGQCIQSSLASLLPGYECRIERPKKVERYKKRKKAITSYYFVVLLYCQALKCIVL